MAYIVQNWYWFVGSDKTRAYSSAIGDYVLASNSTFVSWQTIPGNAPTTIDTEANLGDVLAAAIDRLTVLTSTVLVIQQALKQRQLDDVLVTNADNVTMVKGGQSTTVTGAGLSQFLATSTNNYRTLRAQIAAATTPAQVRAININSGWPANP